MAKFADPVPGRCLDCDYPLQGLATAACPECGRPFDPADAATMSSPRRMPPLVRALLRPPGWPMAAGATALAALTLIAVSPPGSYFGLLILSGMGWLGLGLCWVLRGLTALVITGIWGWAHIAGAKPVWRWTVVPAAAVVLYIVGVSGLPVHVTRSLSMPAMNRLARQIQQTGQIPSPPPEWIGLYPVSQIEIIPDGYRFIIRGADFLSASGYAYSPNANPQMPDDSSYYEPLSNGWYRWTLGWD